MLNIILRIIYLSQIGFVFLFSKNKKIKELTKENEDLKKNLICKFVFDGADKKIGESIAIKEDILIIKSGKKYLGVPIKHIDINEKTLLVKGLIEQDKAEKMGEDWKKESFKEIDYRE